MLMLTRKSGQSINIGDDITITITEIAGDRVKLGIEAPKELKVLREELCQTVRSNQQAVSGVTGDTLRRLAANLRGSDKSTVQGAQKEKEPPENGG